MQLLTVLFKITPEGGTVLDPFMGSGSTGQACLETGREMSKEYYDIARKRLLELR